MSAPTRRTLLTAAAGALAASGAAPALGQDVEEGGEFAVFASRKAASRKAIPASVGALYCGGFDRAGDRGEAIYVRADGEPRHAGMFQSADGGWWGVGENMLNPFIFGAKGDNRTNDSPAIQAMFDFIAAKARPCPVRLMGAKYYVREAITLPRVPVFIQLDIDGGGATLRTDQPITILGNAAPANQAEASRAMGKCAYEIHDLVFEGNNKGGQIGLHLIATYTSVVRSCYFAALDYGSIGTFCLAAAWRDNRYLNCAVRGAMIQTAIAYDSGKPLWPDATLSSTPSHVNVFENCRVCGHKDQISAFGIFGCDSARLNGCISEGAGANADVHFDFHSSTTVKNFAIHMFHCEAPNGKLNFKIRAAGKVFIDNVIRSYPAALLDASGSTNCEINIKGIAWLANMPVATGSGSNPNGRWFYHSDGGGYGGTESGRSGGVGFRFDDCEETASRRLSDPAHWEGGTLPWMLHVRGLLPANGGVQEWSNAPISFATPITLADGNTLAGFRTGNVAAATTSVPAQSTVTEAFAVKGLLYSRHHVYANPYNGGQAPPPGIVWNAYIASDDVLHIRFTNVTVAPIAMAAGAQWAWCAMRQT